MVGQRISRSTGQPKPQAGKLRKYQMEFNELSTQRTLPAQLIRSQDALAMLIDNYNCSELEGDGEDYYCLPDNTHTEGEDSVLGIDHFETIQDMRENLCAFGLPPIAKGSKLSKANVNALESWVRCANMVDVLYGDLHGEPASIPEYPRMKPKVARSILKGLGYSFSDNIGAVVLPETKLHNANYGVDRFDKLADLFNHIARFGLSAEPDSDVSEEERLKLQIHVASVSTFDVR